MVYTFARVRAPVAMNVEDYYPQGKRWWELLHEKGESFTRCRVTTSFKSYWMPTSMRPGIEKQERLPSFTQ